MVFMSKRGHSGVEWAVVRWVVYGAAVIDFFLFVIWFFVPIAAIRISGLILAIVIGGIRLFNLRLFPPFEQKLKPAIIETRAGSLAYFTVAVLLGVGNKLSPASAFGIFALALCTLMLFITFHHRRDEKPRWIAIGILMALGFGALGIFLIYAHPSFTLSDILPGMIGGFIGGFAAQFILKRHRARRERTPEGTESTAPRAG